MISVTKGMSPWGLVIRWIGVLLLAVVAQGWVYASMEVGDSALVFTRFVLVVFLYGIARSLVASVMLVLHKRRLRRIPSEIDGKELGGVVTSLREDRSPFVGVLRALYEQFRRNHAALDAGTLIKLLRYRLHRAGPQRTVRTASLSLTLGFAGTAFGLIFTLNGLSAAAAVAGRDGAYLTELLFGPEGPLSQLGGAYLSTLVALCGGSIVLRALAHVQADSVEDLVDEFTEIVSVYVKPSFRQQSQGAPPASSQQGARLTGAQV